MKKLLILMLVLGLASVASAQLRELAPVATGPITWTIQGPAGLEVLIGFNASGAVSPGGVGYGIDVGNSGMKAFVAAIAPIDPANGNFLGSLPPAPQPPLPAVQAFNAGDLGRVLPGLGPWWDAFDGTAGVSPPVPASNWYEFDILGGALVGDWIDLYDYSVSWYTPVGTIVLVPEPMTIMLLGLGGLLLRRRK